MVPKPHATIGNKQKAWPRQSRHHVGSRRYTLKTIPRVGYLMQCRRLGVDSCVACMLLVIERQRLKKDYSSGVFFGFKEARFHKSLSRIDPSGGMRSLGANMFIHRSPRATKGFCSRLRSRCNFGAASSTWAPLDSTQGCYPQGTSYTLKILKMSEGHEANTTKNHQISHNHIFRYVQ